MANFNKVLVGYCSGDSYISNEPSVLGNQGKFFDSYYMKGYGNTYALFDKLAKKYKFGAHPAGEDMVIGGEGAGAIGVLFTLELKVMPFKNMIKAVVDSNSIGPNTDLRILGLFDSALELDRPGYGNTANPFVDPIK